MDWALKIIIGLLIINLLWAYYLKREILNPKRYYLINNEGWDKSFVSYIKANGDLKCTVTGNPRWRLPDAMKAKEVFPYLKIIDCATLKEVEE